MIKSAVISAAVVLSIAAFIGPANAAGCLKGAVVGGIAGHYAGHHGLLGAGAGCLVGRHYANKQQARQNTNNQTVSGSSVQSQQMR